MNYYKPESYTFVNAFRQGEYFIREFSYKGFQNLVYSRTSKENYFANNRFFDFYLCKRDPVYRAEKDCFLYFFDFVLFNIDVLKQILGDEDYDLSLFPCEFSKSLDIFIKQAQLLDIIDSSNKVKMVIEKSKNNVSSTRPKIYTALEHYLKHVFANEQLNDYDRDYGEKIFVFVKKFVKAAGFNYFYDNTYEELLDYIKSSAKFVRKFFIDYNAKNSKEKKTFLSNEDSVNKTFELFKKIGDISNCIGIIAIKLSLSRSKDFSFDRVLCDELYQMLLESLKSNIFDNNFYDVFDFRTLCSLIFSYCKLALEPEIKSNDYSLKSKHVDGGKQILKFYYLSTFFGNPIANSINVSLINNNLAANKTFNPIAGFSSNLTLLKKQNEELIKKYLIIADFSISSLLNSIGVGKHNVFETALYNKTLMDYYPIFNGMEYTPVIVNLFKGAEELCAELLKLLRVDRIKNIDNLKDFNKPFKNFTFLDDGWENELTIGNLEKIIDFLNSGDGGPAVSQYKGIYDREYAHYFSKRKQMLIDFMSEHSVKLNIDYTKIQNTNTPSNLLYETFDVWRDKCRNNRVHKDNTLQKEPVEAIFEFTYIVISMLLEWEYLLENK